MITTIMFDLDETLISWIPRYLDGLFQAFSRYTADLEPGKTRSIEYCIHDYWSRDPNVHLLLEDRERWGEYFRDFIQPIFVKNGVVITYKQAVQALEEFVTTYAPSHVLFDDVVGELEYLKACSYRLAVLTNRHDEAETVSELERFGISRSFDAVLVSGALGFWKPDSRVFIHASRELEESPQRILYIGDNYFTDIVGAKRAGLQAILLDRNYTYSNDAGITIHSLPELREKIREFEYTV